MINHTNLNIKRKQMKVKLFMISLAHLKLMQVHNFCIKHNNMTMNQQVLANQF